MKDLDQTMDYMENSRFNYLYGPMVMHMENSRFSEIELLCIAIIYHKFTIQGEKGAKFMTVEQLSKCILILFKITDKRINMRIVRTIAVDPECKDPQYLPNYHCSLNSFVRMFSLYFSQDLEERMQFVFSVSIKMYFACLIFLNFLLFYQVYDEDSVGFISRELVIKYITTMFEGEDDDEVFELRAVRQHELSLCFNIHNFSNFRICLI